MYPSLGLNHVLYTTDTDSGTNVQKSRLKSMCYIPHVQTQEQVSAYHKRTLRNKLYYNTTRVRSKAQPTRPTHRLKIELSPTYQQHARSPHHKPDGTYRCRQRVHRVQRCMHRLRKKTRLLLCIEEVISTLLATRRVYAEWNVVANVFWPGHRGVWFNTEKRLALYLNKRRHELSPYSARDAVGWLAYSHVMSTGQSKGVLAIKHTASTRGSTVATA